MASKKILVLSPHLDDAVLSCADYCLKKKQEKFEIFVVSIFTKFNQSNYLSSDAISYMHSSGANKPEQFEKNRKKEDQKAMNFLSFSYTYLNFVDAGFRTNGNKPTYKTYKQLFSGQIAKTDLKLITKIKSKIKNFNKNYEEVLIPYGIGNHADHIITRKTAELVFDEKKIKYYLDQPYALKIKNWHLQPMLSIFKNQYTIRLTSNKKKKTLKLYKSQINILFGPMQQKILFIPELIIS